MEISLQLTQVYLPSLGKLRNVLCLFLNEFEAPNPAPLAPLLLLWLVLLVSPVSRCAHWFPKFKIFTYPASETFLWMKTDKQKKKCVQSCDKAQQCQEGIISPSNEKCFFCCSFPDDGKY